MKAHRDIAVLLAILALGGGLGCAAGEQPSSREPDRPGEQSAERAPAPRWAPARPASPAPAPSVRLVATPGLRVARDERAALEAAARRFGLTLTRWLYGPRRRLDVAPLAPEVRQHLASDPPYIPDDQRASGEGHMQGIEVALQTTTSGVVTVVVTDLRTSYRVPANFERRDGSWQIVELRSH